MWIIVEFPSERSVEAIPNEWVINENLVYWPCAKGDKIKQMILKCTPPEPSWPKCRARLLGKGKVYDTFRSAAEAVAKAEYTSDFSDSEKRKIKKPNRIICSSSSDSGSEIDDKLRRRLPSYKALMDGEAQSRSVLLDEEYTSIVEADVHLKSQSVPVAVEQTVESQKKSRSGTSTCQNRTDQINVQEETHQPNEANCCHTETTVNVLKQLKELNLKLDLILKELGAISSIGSPAAAAEKPTYDFPIKSMEDLRKFEQKIKEEKNFYDEVVMFIFRRGGSTAFECVKRSLSIILSDNIQTQYNWNGHKNKSSFKELALSKALFDGVMKNKFLKEQTTESEIEKAVKSYLKHAPDRVRHAQKNNE